MGPFGRNSDASRQARSPKGEIPLRDYFDIVRGAPDPPWGVENDIPFAISAIHPKVAIDGA